MANVNERKKVDVIAEKIKEAIFVKLDENGNGIIDVQDVLCKAIKVPGVKIKREDFLKRELMNKYPQEVVDKAIATSPLKAGIPQNVIDKLANDCVKLERNLAAGFSMVLSAPSIPAMLVTVPADIIQYHACMLRVMQKLMYLYGFPCIDYEGETLDVDDGTMNLLLLCLAVMYGVSGANKAIKKVAERISLVMVENAAKNGAREQVVYRLIKKVLEEVLKIPFTEGQYPSFIKKIIPVIGAVVGGGLTAFSFQRCCNRLKKCLQETILSDPKYKPDLDDETESVDGSLESDIENEVAVALNEESKTASDVVTDDTEDK